MILSGMPQMAERVSAASPAKGDDPWWHLWAHLSGNWGDFFGATNDAVQTAALVVGGGFAYVKYIRGRIHYASLLLNAEATPETIDQRKCLRISTTITNSGTYRMVFTAHSTQSIAVRCLDRQTWTAECDEPQVRWGKAMRVGFDQLVDTSGVRDAGVGLEPGESQANSWLVPLPIGDWVAYRVVFRVEACRELWRKQSEPFTWKITKILVEG